MKFPQLSHTPIFESLSQVGKEMFQPNGIFYWSGRAKKEAEINATIGSAYGNERDLIPEGKDRPITYYFPDLRQYTCIDPERFVSYAPIPGVPTFREIWHKWIIFKGEHRKLAPRKTQNISSLISKPIICNGITHAISLCSRLFLDPHETIICPNKKWGNYNLVLTQQNEIQIEAFQFFKDGKYNVAGMIDAMQKVALTQKKIVLILNFPNNPTGYCPTSQEVEAIANALDQFCSEVKIPVIILCDDAYEGYTYSDQVIDASIFYDLLDLHPLLIPIKMDGASKEMLMYGGRIASITLGVHPEWIAEPDRKAFDDEWDNKLQGMVRSTISNSNHFCQEVLVEMLKDGFEPTIQARGRVNDILMERYHETLRAFAKYPHEKLSMDPAGGGFFVFINVDGIPAEKFADHLLVEHKIGTFPMVSPALGINGIRFAFCSVPTEKIDMCFERILKTVEALL